MTLSIVFGVGSCGVRNVKEAFWGRDTVRVKVHDTIYLEANYKEIEEANRYIERSVEVLRLMTEETRKIDVYEQTSEDIAKTILNLRKHLHEARVSLNDTVSLGPIDNYQEGYEEGYETGYDDGIDEGKERAKYDY